MKVSKRQDSSSTVEAEITKIKVRVDDFEIELSIDEARKIYDSLQGIFGKNDIPFYPYWNPFQYPSPFGGPNKEIPAPTWEPDTANPPLRRMTYTTCTSSVHSQTSLPTYSRSADVVGT